MKRALYSDQDILNGLRNKDRKMIRFVYTGYFRSIQRLIIKNSGNTEDAEDIFQDVMVILYKKIKNKKLKLTCSLKTYMYAICRNLWLQKLQNKDNSNLELREVNGEHIKPFELNKDMQYEEKYNLYQKHFLKLSDDCQEVLKLFLKKASLKEIANIMGFSSVDYAKTRKYLCKKNLIERILNDPECKKFN